MGIALDAVFSVSTKARVHYSGTVGLWLYGEGANQHIWDETDGDPIGEPTGYMMFANRSVPVDMSPIFPTKMQDTRYLAVSLVHSSQQYFGGKQADPWRPMLAKYFSDNGYDSRYVQGVLLPDVEQERTIWIAVWANGLIAVVVLYGIWPGSHRFVVWRIRLNRERKGCCPMCAYDLRGTSGGGGGCPECGWRRELEV